MNILLCMPPCRVSAGSDSAMLVFDDVDQVLKLKDTLDRVLVACVFDGTLKVDPVSKQPFKPCQCGNHTHTERCEPPKATPSAPQEPAIKPPEGYRLMTGDECPDCSKGDAVSSTTKILWLNTALKGLLPASRFPAAVFARKIEVPLKTPEPWTIPPAGYRLMAENESPNARNGDMVLENARSWDKTIWLGQYTVKDRILWGGGCVLAYATKIIPPPPIPLPKGYRLLYSTERPGMSAGDIFLKPVEKEWALMSSLSAVQINRAQNEHLDLKCSTKFGRIE